MDGMAYFALFVLNLTVGCAVMYTMDALNGFELTQYLRDRWPSWLPGCTPNFMLSIFWPAGLVWALLRKDSQA